MSSTVTPSAVRREVITALYPDHDPVAIEAAVDRLIAATELPRPVRDWDERTAWLIAYPDQVRAPNEAPLVTVRRALVEHLQPEITGVHLLPFHPSSSDGGFSVVTFDEIEPTCGTWDDIRALSAVTDLMADAVVNHASAESEWFRRFLAGDEAFAGLFREVDPTVDLSAVVRPRSTPIPTTFIRPDGSTVTVWATFSRDQVDLDYRDPAVLLRMTEVILRYAAAGATAIRLDAVAFLWKVEATASIHLPETHAIIRFFRACLDELDPRIVLVTETNVPHEENISYFGPAPVREAQAVYQFPLPPLVLHAFVSGSAAELTAWARSLEFDRSDTTFLNFLASHDGIGVRPVEGLLDADDLGRLESTCRAAGGVVNARRLPDGTNAAYELTGTWYSHMAVGHDDDEALDRHLASHAIALALRGVPLLYVHSLAASTNDVAAFDTTGHGRDLNRATFDMEQVRTALDDPESRAHRCLHALRTMLRHRASCPAFRPDAPQEVLDGPDEAFLIRRIGPDGVDALVAVNVSDHAIVVDLPDGLWIEFGGGPRGRRIDLPPWSSCWLRSGRS